MERGEEKHGKYGKNLTEVISAEDFIQDGYKPSYS